MKKFVPFLLALALIAPAYAQDDPAPPVDVVDVVIESPLASITGPDGEELLPIVPAGEPIFLSAKKAIHAKKKGSILWRVLPAERRFTSRAADNGELFIVGPGVKPGVAIIVQQIVTLNDQIAISEIVFTVQGVEPMPDTPPVKPDDPITPTPIPVSGIKGKLIEITSGMDGAQRLSVATVFRSVAKQMEAKQLTTMQQVTTATADQMRAVLGTAKLLPWLSWRNKVTDVLITAGQYNTVAENAVAWNVIADVLENK